MRHFLAAAASITALTLVACDDSTETPGETTETPASLDGSVFALNPGALTIDDADPGLPDIVRLFMDGNLYLQTAETGDQVGIMFAFGLDDGGQDLCVPTSDLGAATRTGNTLAMSSPSTILTTTRQDFESTNIVLDAQVSDDGQTLSGITLNSTVDLRQAIGFGTFTDLDGVCSTFGALGVTCDACPDGTMACADLTLRNLAANKVDVSLQPWTAADVSGQNCPTE